jgi:hypothetical protein
LDCLKPSASLILALFMPSATVSAAVAESIAAIFSFSAGHSRQFKKKAGLKTRFYRYKDKIHFDNFRTIVK